MGTGRDQGTDRLANARPRDIRGRRLDDAGEFQPRDVGGARRRRIKPLALLHVRPVQPCRNDTDHNFTRTGRRHMPFNEPNDLRPAGTLVDDRAHQFTRGALSCKPMKRAALSPTILRMSSSE